MSEDRRPQLAYDMALAQLSAQVSAIDELRARVGVVLSGASVATGFLAGQALNSAHGIPGSAWLAIVFAVALIVASAYVLWPREWNGLAQQAGAILTDIKDVPDRDTGPVYVETMAGYAVAAAQRNTERLRDLYRVFSLSLAFLVLDFGGWIWTLATNNRD